MTTVPADPDALTEQLDRIDLVADSPELWGGTAPDNVVSATKELLEILFERDVDRPGIYPLLEAPGFDLEWAEVGSHLVAVELSSEGALVYLVVTAKDDPGDSDDEETFPLWDTESIAARIQGLLDRG